MTVIPVLFEDHTWTHFRPLAFSRPLFEIRVGMFCLRERVTHLTETRFKEGILLGRPQLDGLQRASHWIKGWEAAAAIMDQPDNIFLWVNGRVDWGHDRLSSLAAMAASGKPLHIQDNQGILAFSCPAHDSRKILEDWSGWSELDNDPASVTAWEPDLQAVGDATEASRALQWIWDIVPRTPALLSEDLEWAKTGVNWTREPHGVFLTSGNPEPIWTRPTHLRSWAEETPENFRCRPEALNNPDEIWCGPDVQIGAGVAIDASAGPVILDLGVEILPNCYLEGPLYIGPGSRVKAGAAIYGESSFGIGNRLAGEIGESTFGDFANKQHEGFIGHAVLGSWVNLGALTTCSDLKNNYGNVRVDLGSGQVDSGLRFVGLLLGDHAKTAIGTMFNTGTCVGFASNIFGGGMPPKHVGNFSWGGQVGAPAYGIAQALATAEVVMSRRGCLLVDEHRQLFEKLSTSAE